MKYSHADFEGSPLEVGNLREKALADGLRRFAAAHGFKFREPLAIDSNAENPEGEACGEFGTAAPIIAKHRPRTGYAPSNHMSPENGWCRMNHFDVQALLEEVGP